MIEITEQNSMKNWKYQNEIIISTYQIYLGRSR